MKVISVSCNHCGAPLEVPKKARFVTCKYCSSRLAIKATESATYTEVLEAIGERTEKIAQDVETIKLQNRLERLDREWQTDRRRFMTRDKHGVERLLLSQSVQSRLQIRRQWL